MTDKQIIIDSVDVSGCENFSCGICEEENKIPKTINHFTADCRMYPNCYYKQLKRKEQECEELKQVLIEIEEIAKNMNKECFYDDFDCKYCDMKNGCTYRMKIKILQKISECEVK